MKNGIIMLLGVVILIIIAYQVMASLTAPEFIITVDGVVMKWDSRFDPKLASGYYQLKRVGIKTTVIQYE